jgi:ribosomal protein S18 acetylase RimI-like enzyme
MIAPPHRAATRQDAAVLAERVNMAGKGLPLYIWPQMAGPGEDAWDVGRRRAALESGSFTYRNAIVREEDGRVAAALIGYPLPDRPEPSNLDEIPPMFVPLQQLEDLAPATRYVNVLATYPEVRGRGFGGELLAVAEDLAAGAGKTGLSIIVSDGNTGAIRLYRRSGYEDVATRPMVKDDWQSSGQN